MKRSKVLFAAVGCAMVASVILMGEGAAVAETTASTGSTCVTECSTTPVAIAVLGAVASDAKSSPQEISITKVLDKASSLPLPPAPPTPLPIPYPVNN